jgi:hypothetical protein
VIDRGSVRIQRVHAKGNPPPTIKAPSFLGGLKLSKLFEVLVSPKIRFSQVATLAGHFLPP